MEEGCGYIFILAIIIVVVMAALGVIAATAAAVFAAGFLHGIFSSLDHFYQTVVEAHKKVSPSKTLAKAFSGMYKEQPAHILYPFGKGWQVIGYTFEHIFERTAETTQDNWFTWASDASGNASVADGLFGQAWWFAVAIGAWLGGASHYLSAMASAFLFVTIQTVFLTVWMGILGMLMLTITLYNMARSSLYKIFIRCPNANCHESMKIPIYVCPKCATTHSRLWPSVYGVFAHTCDKCGTRLPTLDAITINGLQRQTLTQRCPICNRPFNKEIGRLRNVHIPVVGGPSTGKSNYIVMATSGLIEGFAPSHGYDVVFPDEKHKRNYEANIKELKRGHELAKTPTADIAPEAYNIALKKVKKSPFDIGRIVYVYDPAGEMYADQDRTAQQSYFRWVHGVIFIVDPFAISEFRKKHDTQVDKLRTQLRPSSLGIMSVFERMTTTLETDLDYKNEDKFDFPIAVVLSKVDAIQLEGMVGSKAANKFRASHADVAVEEDAIDILARDFLKEHGMGNLVRAIDLRFNNVKYFSCSALGRMPDPDNSKAYHSVRTLEPFIWLLNQTHAVNVRKERCTLVDKHHLKEAKKKSGIFKQTHYYYWGSLKGTNGRCNRCDSIKPEWQSIHLRCVAERFLPSINGNGSKS